MDNEIWCKGATNYECYACPHCGVLANTTDHTKKEEGCYFRVKCVDRGCQRHFIVTVSDGQFYSCEEKDFIKPAIGDLECPYCSKLIKLDISKCLPK